MSRQLFALALLIGGIVVAIVNGQENEPAPFADPSESAGKEASEIWSDESVKPSVFNEPPTPSSRYSVAPAAAEDDEADGLRSVLKRRPGEATEAANEVPLPDSGKNYSSRRATTREPQEEGTSSPILTARNPRANRRGTGTAVAAKDGLQLKSTGPSLEVEAQGPAAITVGKSATYRVTIVNSGSESAHDVVVTISVPATVALDNSNASAGGASRNAQDGSIQWTIPTLAGNAREQLELQLTPRDDRPFTLSMDWTMRSAALATTIEVQKPALAVAITGPNEIIYGASQVYTITISNPGTGPAENVNLVVKTDGGDKAKPIGTIASGAQEQVRMELIAREAGTLSIGATATADGLNESATKSIVVRRAELAVEIAGPAYKFAGTAGDYQIRVRNQGNAPAGEVQLSLNLPTGMQYVSGLEPSTQAAGRLTWMVPELTEGEEQLFTVQVQYQQAGTLVCEISAEAAGELTAAAQCETEVEAIADLAMAVGDPPGPSAVGEEVTYEIRITNRGSKAAAAVNVIGQFAQGIEPVRAEGHGAEVVTGQVIFKPLPSIAAGETVSLKIVARAEKPGNHRFRAVLKCSDPDTELVAEDTTAFFGDNAKAASRKSNKSR